MPVDGLVIMQRLHRLVRHGYRPWLGYDVASGQDCDIQLHFRRSVASLSPDGSVAFSAPVALAVPRPGPDGALLTSATMIAHDDAANFDALFPPNAPNRRNLTRRLYEMGF